MPRAKTLKDMLYTVSLTLNGSRAAGGPYPGGQTEIKGATVGDNVAYVVMALAQFLSFGAGTIPEEKMKATVQSLGHFAAEMVLPKHVAHMQFVRDFVALVLRYQRWPTGLRVADAADLGIIATQYAAHHTTAGVEYRVQFPDSVSGYYELHHGTKRTVELGPFVVDDVEVWVAGDGFLVPHGVTELLSGSDLRSIVRNADGKLDEGVRIVRYEG